MPKWTPEIEAQLLRGIIKHANLTGKEYDELAEYLGNQFTPRAIKEHIIIMQKAAPPPMAETTDPSNPITTQKATPQKRAPRTPKGEKASGSGNTSGKKRKAKAQTSDDDSPLADGSPIKRVKPEQRAAVKAEDTEGLVYF
ncbi:hypothetical protein FQN50_006352 [Emmonsiellopsis sp. PD_5]|nr:hypothetical protein FQN50_006352 [Emmonsiellopsis sp. PD_5]